MKRTFLMLVVLFVVYLSLQVLTKVFSDGHFFEYNLTRNEKQFSIKETYINKKNQSNYFFEISSGSDIFYFQTYEDFSKADTIIKDIKYTEIGNYKCILPVFFGNKVVLDITCLDGKLVYNYADIATKNRDLDNWVNSLSEVYSVSKFKDDLTNTQIQEKTTIYPANVLKMHYVAIENYRGLETINSANFKKLANVQIFAKDEYSRPISAYSDKYYITADYSEQDKLNKFIVVDIIENEKTSIETKKDISFDSYIMGSVDNSVYLFDRKNDKQYQINIKTKKIIEVGNREVGVKFYNDSEWEWIPFDEIKEDIKFNGKSTKNSEYDKVDNVLGENGITYYYKKNGSIYDVFMSPTRAEDFKKYIFSTEDINTLIYKNDYIYFKNSDTIYYYHSSRGLRALYQNPELKFNPNLKFGVYLNN